MAKKDELPPDTPELIEAKLRAKTISEIFFAFYDQNAGRGLDKGVGAQVAFELTAASFDPTYFKQVAAVESSQEVYSPDDLPEGEE